MRKLLALSAAICLFPVATLAQSPGELLGSAAVNVPADIFDCRRGESACNLQVRTYNELDPTDFLGSANPVDGFPRFASQKKQYLADVQITGNYPSAGSVLDLNWYSIWDGGTAPGTFDHVGYYGAQSQVVTFSELGNPTSPTCLPVVAQMACFMALTPAIGQDIRSFGPAGAVVRAGGLSPLPRPEVVSTSPGQVQLAWEEAANATINDGAPHPILGYRLFFQVRSRFDRLGPSDSELSAQLLAGTLIDATPGTFIPRATTSFTLQATDPVLAGFDPATDSLVAVIKLVYAQDVDSLYFSANSFPFTFSDLADRVTDFRARLERNHVVLNWTVDSVAGVESFNVLRSDQAGGSYFPISRDDVVVAGSRGTFATFDRLKGRLRGRGGAESRFYRLELNGLDGSRVLFDPVEVDIRPARRDRGVH